MSTENQDANPAAASAAAPTPTDPAAVSDAAAQPSATPTVAAEPAAAPAPAAAAEPAAAAAAEPTPAAEPAAADAPAATEPAAAPAATEPAAAVEAAAADAPATPGDAKTEPSDTSNAPKPAAAAADAGGAEQPKPAASNNAEGGEPKKKRRRRRRKKKGAEGEAQAAGETKDGGPKPPRKSRRGRSGRPGGKPSSAERPAFNEGDEVFGKVIKLTRDAVLIEVAGGKATGLFDRAELIQIPPKEGEQFIAKVRGISSRGGMLSLGDKVWDLTETRTELRAALETSAPLQCFVTGVIKGGLEVEFKGVRGFAPASHVEVRPSADLSHMLGEKLPFVVVHYGKRGRDVVMSRKHIVEEAYKEKRAEQLAKIEPDMECKAVVRTVLNWGAFVSLPDFDDVEGVIHMSEASHDRGARMSSIFKVGKEIAVKVLRVDEKGKLWLSHKATIDDPWLTAPEKYAAGSYHTCPVVRITDFGAFLQLEPGIDGLCHVSDLSLNVIEHPQEVCKVGDSMEVVVAYVDVKGHKLTLHPAPPEDERDKRRGRIAQYQQVDVVVTQIRDNGLGVRIIGATGRHARGFIPASQTGTERGADLRKSFPLGGKLSVKVLDVGRGETRMSIRALKKDAEKAAYRDYRKKVQKESSFGTFADLLKGKI